MKDSKKRKAARMQRGFSLVELMVVMAILTTVMAVLTDGMIQIEDKSANDENKVGVAQESRQFMDQILRDLRQSGFPSLKMFDPTTLTSGTDVPRTAMWHVPVLLAFRRLRFNSRETLTEAA